MFSNAFDCKCRRWGNCRKSAIRPTVMVSTSSLRIAEVLFMTFAEQVTEVGRSLLTPLDREWTGLIRHWCNMAVTRLSQPGYKAGMFYPAGPETIVRANSSFVDMAFPRDP